MKTLPTYGSSPHYLGDQGEKYFAWQNVQAEVGGQVNARKFSHLVTKDARVLDFGCGGGFLLKHLVCHERIGVEINPVAQRRAIENGLRCHGDLAEVSDGSVDVVISNHALEHVPFPIQALSELRRVLTPGGVLALVLPIDDWRNQMTYDATDINHHLHTWTPLLMGNALVEAGFSSADIEVSILSHAWFPGALRAYESLPSWCFDAMCRIYAALTKRRQLVAVARKRFTSTDAGER